jgi:hypothetical protein
VNARIVTRIASQLGIGHLVSDLTSDADQQTP